MTDEVKAALEQPLGFPKCGKCHGKGKLPERRGISFETDTPTERALCWHDVRCPDCANLQATIRAALEQAQREREADVLSWGNAAIEAQHAETAAVERAELAERRIAELEATLAAARERGRREGLEEAAQIADDRESEWSRDYQMMLVPSEHMLGKAHGAREIAAAIHAAKEAQ